MNGSNQKITGYIKVIEPTANNLMSDVDRKVLRITRRRDEIVLDLTVRDKKQHYFYDDYNAKFFMPEPCFNDCGRDIDRICGQDPCDLQFGIVTNVSQPEPDDREVFPPTPSGGGTRPIGGDFAGGGGFITPGLSTGPISRIQIGRVLAKKKGVQLGLVCLVELRIIAGDNVVFAVTLHIV